MSGSRWRLAWKVSLPALKGRMTASLRVRAYGGAAPATHILCTRRTTRASGALTVAASQAMRIANGHAFVVVRTRSATLRGTVRSLAVIPVAN
jgi:hypothetical protein